MNERAAFDTIVVGAGVMGATVAYRLATAGQKVAILDKGGVCMQASGANAGTLSIQIKRAALIPYALKGWELWKTAQAWLGAEVGFKQTGGLTAAFTPAEAEQLRERMEARRANGAPIEFVGVDRARALEPGISDRILLGSWCPLDGYASSDRLGAVFRAALRRVGAEVREFSAVQGIARDGNLYSVRTSAGTVRGARVVVAGGASIEALLRRDFGIAIPLACRVNQVTVTERLPPVVRTIISVASGLLTLKQSGNGTVLIGGGWQGLGSADTDRTEIIPENLVGNLRLAQHAIPALTKARIVRTWLGTEAASPDWMPLVGPIPGASDAYVIGCVRGGYTIGPWMGTLLAQRILEEEPAMPLFDPARVASPAPIQYTVDNFAAGSSVVRRVR
jgi:glycine/D-amino acid oxidase-like deaminating enzyme